MIANLALLVVSLVVGWIALLPMRRDLGPVLYHLSAFPAGAIGWSFIAGLTTVLDTPPDAFITAVGLAAYSAVVAAVSHVAVRGEREKGMRPLEEWRGFAVFGSAFVLVAAGLTFSGLTLVGFDSYSHYELSGWYLHDTGLLSDVIMNSRSPLVPALHMGNRVLGSDWLHAVFPMMSLHALALVGWGAWRHAFAGLPRIQRVAGTAITCTVLAVTPAWVYHSWFVHSNMASALYLTLSVVAMIAATGGFAVTRSGAAGEAASAAAALLAGLAAAGLALARPDGLAYAFIPMALVALAHAAGHLGPRALYAFYAALLVPLGAVYAAAFAHLGLWTSGKLRGSWAAAILVGMVVFAAVTWLVPRVRALKPFLGMGDVARVAVLVNLALAAVVSYRYSEELMLTVRNMAANLLKSGGWGLTWYALAFALVLSLLFWTRRPDPRWRRLMLYATFQFFALALVIHTTTHPGRIKMTDSFNRVALHIVPVIVLYLASYAGSLLSSADEMSASATVAEERSVA